MKIIVQ